MFLDYKKRLTDEIIELQNQNHQTPNQQPLPLETIKRNQLYRPPIISSNKSPALHWLWGC